MKIAIQMTVVAIVLQAVNAAPKDYLPQPPPADKAPASYSVQDVVGCAFSWRDALPNGHPFKGKDGIARIRAEWPGSKVATNIDAMLAYVFLASTPYEEDEVAEGIFWAVHELMDVSGSDKAAAVERTYLAQSDAVKRRQIAFVAGRIFPYLADMRLLSLLKDMLGNAATYRTERPEGGREIKTTVRRSAGAILRRLIFDKELLSLDLPGGGVIMSSADQEAIFADGLSEAASCSLFKDWIEGHWSELSSQAAKARALSERKYSKPRKKSLGMISKP